MAGLRVRLAELEHSDEALRESRERLRVVTDSVPVLISYIDSDLTYRFVNCAYERWFGRSRQEIEGRRVPDVLDEVAFARSKPFLDRVLQGEEVEFEGRAEMEDGASRYFLTHCVPDRGAEGGVKGYFAVVADITEVKVATEALRASEVRLRSVIEGAPVVLWSTDAEGTFTLSEGRGLKSLGLEPGEVVGRSAYEVYASVPEIVDGISRALRGETHTSIVRVGEVVFESHFQPQLDTDGQVIGLVGVASDITERTRVAEELRVSEAKYRALFEDIPDPVVVFDQATDRILDCNHSLLERYGYTLEEMRTMTPLQLHPRDTWEHVRDNIDDIEDDTAHTYTQVTRSGELLEVETHTSAIDYQGRPAWITILRDVTERKRAEDALRKSEAKYRELVEEISDIIYAVDVRGIVTYVSPAMKPLAGYETGEVIGRPFTDFVHAEDVPRVMERFGGVVAGGQGQLTELRVITSSGEPLWVQTTSRPVMADGRVAGVHGVLVDITERRNTEREMSRLERLRGLGEMSAGISHNLNNILVGILGPAELLKAMSDDPAVRAEAEEILAAGERARELVERLNRTVRGERGELLQEVALNRHVRDVIQMARPRWKDDAEARGLTIELIEDLEEVPPIAAAAAEVDELLLNLLFNAVDAMPEGGTISVRTRADGDLVQLIVADTGVGMDEDTRERLFEPFFTTKMEVGSGLGLSTVLGTVTRWGGGIEVVSAPDEGAEFILSLPRWQEGTAPASGALRGQLPVRRATVLIVDDDAASRRVLSRLLSGVHHVETCKSGQEALARFVPGRFDVAFIDLGMPGMPGDQVAAQLRRADPILSTVLTTGWDLATGDPRLRLFDLHLTKPFGDIDRVTDALARSISLRDSRAAARRLSPAIDSR